MRFPLNRSEHAYLAFDGLSGSILQPYLMRLDAPVSVAQARGAARQLVSAYDRLRAVIVPRVLRYALKVLPDDAIVDGLFEVAWQVHEGVDAADDVAVQAWHNRLLNELVSLEHGLGLRIHFVPHPRTPLLVLSVHHLLLDGRSMMLAIADLLHLLNGQPVQARPMEAPSLMGAIVPSSAWAWPRRIMASLCQEAAIRRQQSACRVVRLPGRAAHHVAPAAVIHHPLPVSAADLRREARRRRTTVNTLMLSLVAEALHAMLGTTDAADRAVVMRLSVDLRPYFPKDRQPEVGNYVGSFVVAAPGGVSFDARLKALEEQVRLGLLRFKTRQMMGAYLFEEALSWMGRTLYSTLLRRLYHRGAFATTSCHLSYLASLDWLNAEGATVRVADIHPTVVSVITPLLGLVELGGRMYLTLSWQTGDVQPATMQAFVARIDEALRSAVATAPVQAPTSVRAEPAPVA